MTESGLEPSSLGPSVTKLPMGWECRWGRNLGEKEKDLLSKAAAAAELLQSCLTLCDPIDGSLPGSSVPGILQARTLEWAAISFSKARMHAKSLPSCPTLCNPMDSSLPGSSVHRIL